VFIILICVFVGYIGIHRSIYFDDYKRIDVLNTEIYKLESDIIGHKAAMELVTGIQKIQNMLNITQL
jgi:hypothetical protein